MDENRTEGVVIARKSTKNVSRDLTFAFLAFAAATFFIVYATTHQIKTIPDDVIVVAILIFFATACLVAGSFPLVFAISALLRPDVVIRDFGEYITIYYAFGKQLTLKYAEIYIFSGTQESIRNSWTSEWTECLFGNLYVKTNKRTYKIGCIKDVVSVRIKLNNKVSYKPPKIW